MKLCVRHAPIPLCWSIESLVRLENNILLNQRPGLFPGSPAGCGNAKDRLQSDKMFCRRHYIDKRINEGWVEGKKGGGLGLTEAGEMVTEVFGY